MPGFFTCEARDRARSLDPYFDDFLELLREEVDLRAEDFAADFFAPVFALERDVDFLAPDFAPVRDLEALFELFLLAAGDFAIADVLSFPFQKGHGNRISRRGEETTKRHVSSNRMQTFVVLIH